MVDYFWFLKDNEEKIKEICYEYGICSLINLFKFKVSFKFIWVKVLLLVRFIFKNWFCISFLWFLW